MAAPSTGIQQSASIFTVTAVAGAAILTVPNALVAGRRILGVLIAISTGFGTSQGLAGIDVGGAAVVDGWGNNIAPTLGTTTSQADFTRADEPIIPGTLNDVVTLSARGGLFDAVGVATVVVQWERLDIPTSVVPPIPPPQPPPFGIRRGADVFRVDSVDNATVLTIPDALVHGRRILGVTYDCTAGFGTSRQLTGIDIGGLGIQDGWGANIAPDLGTMTDQRDFTRGDQPIVPGITNQPVTLSSTGGAFDGVGEALVTVHWETLSPLLALLAVGLMIPQLMDIAGTIINSVRDKIPDPVYSADGTPQPDVDGRFLRVQSLYRWLNNAVRRLTRRCNWTVEDFVALPVRQAVNTYALDARWQQTSDCWVSQFPCTFLNEALTIYPSYAQSAQPYGFGWHKRAGQLEVFLWPAPNFSDSLTMLALPMTDTDDMITVLDATGFLSFGWVQVDQELIQYQQRTGNVLSALRRGASGSTVLAHDATTPVQHCSLWVKGIRTPNPVSRSTDPLEVPLPFLEVLETYVLADVREAEQDRAEAASLRKEADQECERIIRSPGWQQTPGSFVVSRYGDNYGGVGVVPYGPFGSILP